MIMDPVLSHIKRRDLPVINCYASPTPDLIMVGTVHIHRFTRVRSTLHRLLFRGLSAVIVGSPLRFAQNLVILHTGELQVLFYTVCTKVLAAVLAVVGSLHVGAFPHAWIARIFEHGTGRFGGL
jgi:hypothetical protein